MAIPPPLRVSLQAIHTQESCQFAAPPPFRVSLQVFPSGRGGLRCPGDSSIGSSHSPQALSSCKIVVIVRPIDRLPLPSGLPPLRPASPQACLPSGLSPLRPPLRVSQGSRSQEACEFGGLASLMANYNSKLQREDKAPTTRPGALQTTTSPKPQREDIAPTTRQSPTKKTH